MLNNIEYVIKKAKFVKINQDILEKFTSKINSSDIHISLDKNLFNGIEDYEKKVNILFIFSCINFAFWKLDKNQLKKETISTNTSEKIIKAISDLLLKNNTQSLSELLINISLSEFTKLLNNDSNILFIHERWRNLKEAGLILNYKYKNSYINLLKNTDFDAIKSLSLTVKNFPSFDDRSFYDGREIEFHKRAQVLLGFISSISNHSYKLKNIDRLMGGADYRIPQLLRHLKILQYSKHLENMIDNQDLILPGSEEEIEIRTSTLWAINLIKNKLNDNSEKSINAIEIDNYLWKLSKKFGKMKPHHRTVSIYY